MKNDLTALGAPELPAGYFYRVTSDFVGVSVELRRKWRFGSNLVTEAFVFPEQSFSPERALVKACEKVVRFLRVLEDDQHDRRTLASFLGDHK